MELKLFGVRSSTPRPLTPAHYKERVVQILQQYKQLDNPNQSIEEFMNVASPNLARIIGGNTACVLVTLKSKQVLILDAGSGLYELGQNLMKGACGEGKGEIHIFFTHIHLDRVMGLQHFAPLFIEGNKVHFYYPENTLELRLLRLQSPPYNEKPLDLVESETFFHTVPENTTPSDSLHIGDAEIRHLPLLHPGSSYAWKITEGNNSFAYAGSGKVQIQETIESTKQVDQFFSKSNVLFLDSRPKLVASTNLKSWGHHNYETSMTLAKNWQIDHLFLFNHPPEIDDHTLWSEYLRSTSMLPENEHLNIHLAREGQTIKLS